MIKITKIDTSATPDFKSAEWDTFIEGVSNEGVSLPVSYTLKGEFIYQPKVGEVMFVNRSERNGVKNLGIFTSTPVISIKEVGDIKFIETKNSVYACESVED